MQKYLVSLVFALLSPCLWAQTQTTAFEDRFSVPWDNVMHIGGSGVLLNDQTEHGPLVASLVEPPQAGTLDLSADGSFWFTPVEGLQGPVTFVYGAQDQLGHISYATVTIEVIPGNKAPLAIDDYYSVSAGETLVIAGDGVLANDIDLDGETLTASIGTAPESGMLSLQADGGFTYQSDEHASGVFSFTYKARDEDFGEGEGTVYLTVTSQHPPEAVADSYSFTDFYAPNVRVILDVLENDRDLDGNLLQVVEFTQPSQGDLASNPFGGLSYHPPRDFVGRTQFAYTISDGVFQSTATVTIDVANTNEPPVAVDDLYQIPRNVIQVVSPLINDYDPNGDELTVTLLSTPQFGTLEELSDFNWLYRPSDFREDAEEVLHYQVSDGLVVSEARIVIRITGNHPPQANNDAYTVPLNPRGSMILPILDNDRDLDFDLLTISRFTTVNTDSLIVELGADGRSLVATGLRGSAHVLTYWVSDGLAETSATVSIVVPGPTESSAHDDAYTLRVGESLQLNTFDNDVYYEQDYVNAPEHTRPEQGALMWSNGNWVYMHLSEEPGETTFTYTLPGGSSATVTLTILPNE